MPLEMSRFSAGSTRTETGSDGRAWTVRTVSGSEKTYRCPGCGGDVAAGTTHLVAWTEDHLFGAQAGLADRRHWHTQCWRR